jgi:hypothetical protein
MIQYHYSITFQWPFILEFFFNKWFFC